MSITTKIFGTLCFIVGAALLYLEYIILCAIGALGGWIADMVGATGGAHTGITLLAYIPVLGLIILGLIAAIGVFRVGLVLFQEK